MLLWPDELSAAMFWVLVYDFVPQQYMFKEETSTKRLVDFLCIFDSVAKESTEAIQTLKVAHLSLYIMIRLLGENSLNLSGFRQCKKPY